MDGQLEQKVDDLVASDNKDKALAVLSIQSASLGNAVYSQVLREELGADPRIDLKSVWVHDERELLTRVAYRVLDYRIPVPAVSRRKLDLRRARNEAATGLLGRRLADRHVRRGQPDLLHFHTQVPALLSAGLMRRLPVVLSTDQTAVQFAARDTTAPAWTHRPSIYLDRRAFRAAARSIFFSEWARKSALESYGLDPSRTDVIPPGVDTARFEAVRGEHKERRKRPLILFVGNGWVEKGGADLYEVYRERFTDRCELHVVSSWELPDLPGATVHRNVAAFSPPWFELYRSADIFVLPTRCDAFGLVYLEAMAAGLPVIGSRINAVPEIVADGETGLLVQPGDRASLAEALDMLLAHSELRSRMGRAGRERVRSTFDLRNNMRKVADAFLTAAADGPPDMSARGR